MGIRRLCPYRLLKRLFKKLKGYIFRVRCTLFRKLFPDEIYYINGSETLPPPLSQEEEEDMLIALHRLAQDQATEAALAEELGDPQICLRRARAARDFLNNHPHQFSDIPA